MSSVLYDEDYVIIKRPLVSLREYLKNPVTKFVTDLWIPVTQGKELETVNARITRKNILKAIKCIKSDYSFIISTVISRVKELNQQAFLEHGETAKMRIVQTGEDILDLPEIRSCLPSIDTDRYTPLSEEEQECASILLGIQDPQRLIFSKWIVGPEPLSAMLQFNLVWIETQNDAFVSALEKRFWSQVEEHADIFRFYHQDAREEDLKLLYMKELEERRFVVADRHFTWEFLQQYQVLTETFYPEVILDETTSSVWYHVDLFGTFLDVDTGITEGLRAYSPLVYAAFETFNQEPAYIMENPFFRLRDEYRCIYGILLDSFLIKLPLSIDEPALITQLLQNFRNRKTIIDEGGLYVLDDEVALDYQRFQAQIEQELANQKKIEVLWPLLGDPSFHQRLDEWATSAQRLASELQEFRSAITTMLSSEESDLHLVLQILRHDYEDFERRGGGDYKGLTRDEIVKKWIHLLRTAGDIRVSTTLDKALRLRLRGIEEELSLRDEVEIVKVGTGGRPKNVFKYRQL